MIPELLFKKTEKVMVNNKIFWAADGLLTQLLEIYLSVRQHLYPTSFSLLCA